MPVLPYVVPSLVLIVSGWRRGKFNCLPTDTVAAIYFCVVILSAQSSVLLKQLAEYSINPS